MIRLALILASAVLVLATGDVLAQAASPSNAQPPQKADTAPKAPKVIEGPARALAGHILMIANQPIHLFGVHAPRMNDPRGALSRAALDGLISGMTVTCTVTGTDRRQRLVARCQAGNRDLVEAMIRKGQAYARRRNTAEYDGAEAEARQAERGFWGVNAEAKNSISADGTHRFFDIVLSEAIRNWAIVIGGFVGLVLAGWRVRAVAQQARAATTQAVTAQQKEGREAKFARDLLFSELFTKAIEHLGSKSPSIRHGGVHSLEKIARESPNDHRPVMEILARFIREEIPLPEDSEEISAQIEGTIKIVPARYPDVQAALTAIGRRNIDHETDADIIDLNMTNLDGALLGGSNFTRAVFFRCVLTRSSLEKSILVDANLNKTNLSYAKLNGANLQGASLVESKLQEAWLHAANLSGSNLIPISFLLMNI